MSMSSGRTSISVSNRLKTLASLTAVGWRLAAKKLNAEVVRLLLLPLFWQAPPVQEQFRDFIEKAETFILEVIFEQRRGKLANFVRACLFALSKVFEVLVKLRRFLYSVRIL